MGSLNNELFKISGDRTISVSLVRDIRVRKFDLVYTDKGKIQVAKLQRKVIDESTPDQGSHFHLYPTNIDNHYLQFKTVDNSINDEI